MSKLTELEDAYNNQIAKKAKWACAVYEALEGLRSKLFTFYELEDRRIHNREDVLRGKSREIEIVTIDGELTSGYDKIMDDVYDIGYVPFKVSYNFRNNTTGGYVHYDLACAVRIRGGVQLYFVNNYDGDDSEIDVNTPMTCEKLIEKHYELLVRHFSFDPCVGFVGKERIGFRSNSEPFTS